MNAQIPILKIGSKTVYLGRVFRIKSIRKGHVVLTNGQIKSTTVNVVFLSEMKC